MRARGGVAVVLATAIGIGGVAVGARAADGGTGTRPPGLQAYYTAPVLVRVRRARGHTRGRRVRDGRGRCVPGEGDAGGRRRRAERSSRRRARAAPTVRFDVTAPAERAASAPGPSGVVRYYLRASSSGRPFDFRAGGGSAEGAALLRHRRHADGPDARHPLRPRSGGDAGADPSVGKRFDARWDRARATRPRCSARPRSTSTAGGGSSCWTPSSSGWRSSTAGAWSARRRWRPAARSDVAVAANGVAYVLSRDRDVRPPARDRGSSRGIAGATRWRWGRGIPAAIRTHGDAAYVYALPLDAWLPVPGTGAEPRAPGSGDGPADRRRAGAASRRARALDAPRHRDRDHGDRRRRGPVAAAPW